MVFEGSFSENASLISGMEATVSAIDKTLSPSWLVKEFEINEWK
jgi:hypothetical protein